MRQCRAARRGESVHLHVITSLSLQTWRSAVGTLREDGGSCSLWLAAASVAALPTACSRHNTPSQSHALTKLVQSERKKGSQTTIIVNITLPVVTLPVVMTLPLLLVGCSGISPLK